jgi:anti-sigma B factor antagonist
MADLDVTTRTVKPGDERLILSLAFDDSLFVIELYGELDLAGAPKLEHAIARAEETSAVRILVDLSGLHFIDSSGIRVLVTASKRSRSGTDRLRFLRGVGQVSDTIELCGLSDRLPFIRLSELVR